MGKIVLAAVTAALIAGAIVFVPNIPMVASGDSEPARKGDRLDRVGAVPCVDLGWPYTERCGSVRQIRVVTPDRI